MGGIKSQNSKVKNVALQKVNIAEVAIPEWLNIPLLRDSHCYRCEIYLPENAASLENLEEIFYGLFGSDKEDLIIANGEWGAFCLCTFDIDTTEANYFSNALTPLCKQYLRLLEDSHILFDYNGFCKCTDWESFLPVILQCIVNHEALYSPVFYNPIYQYAFYFHHTFSIGLLYNEKGGKISEIIDSALAYNLIIERNDIGL